MGETLLLLLRALMPGEPLDKQFSWASRLLLLLAALCLTATPARAWVDASEAPMVSAFGSAAVPTAEARPLAKIHAESRSQSKLKRAITARPAFESECLCEWGEREDGEAVAHEASSILVRPPNSALPSYEVFANAIHDPRLAFPSGALAHLLPRNFSLPPPRA